MSKRNPSRKPERSRLTGIFLEGFQSIARATFVPIRPLTFLYGPNSAGKSAIHDALGILSDLSSGRNVEVSRKLRRWHRVMAQENAAARPGKRQAIQPLKIGAEICVGNGWTEEVPSQDVEKWTSAFDASFLVWIAGLPGRKVHIELEHRHNDPLGHHEFDAIRVAVNGAPIFQFFPADDYVFQSTLASEQGVAAGQSQEYGPLRIHLNHEFWTDVAELASLVDILGESRPESRRRSGAAMEWLNDCVQWDSNVLDLYDVLPSIPATAKSFRLFETGGSAWVQREKQAKRLLSAVDDLLESLSGFSQALLHIVGAAVTTEHVGAGRTIITRQDATFVAGSGPLDELLAGSHLRTRKPLSQLAAVLAAAEGRRAKDRLFEYAAWPFVDDRGLSILNRSMTRLMPSLRQYRLRAVPFGLQPLTGRRGSKLDQDQIVIRLQLVSAEGTALDLEDVGSGFSHVIPILAALRAGKLVVVEQPELHLHPAAQCDMADVMISARNQGATVIIESHSEHLLLRLLRRVRQTQAGTTPKRKREFSIRPEDVCIAYFDPLEDGTTAVKIIRVSRNGEFVDRWPHGFFEERAEELFGE